MENDEDLFLKIIDRLAKGGVLSDIVLVGSWVLPIYHEFFDNAPEIPVLRTTDLDFLIGMPPKIQREFDVPSALLELGFEAEWSLQGGYCKYVHPEMEVEFSDSRAGSWNRHIGFCERPPCPGAATAVFVTGF